MLRRYAQYLKSLFSYKMALPQRISRERSRQPDDTDGPPIRACYRARSCSHGLRCRNAAGLLWL